MTEDEYAELVKRASTLSEVTNHPGWPLLIDRALATVQARQREVLAGSLEQDEYKRITGWVQGAAWVLELPAMVQSEVAAARERMEEQ